MLTARAQLNAALAENSDLKSALSDAMADRDKAVARVKELESGAP
jgi:hypothetical protein